MEFFSIPFSRPIHRSSESAVHTVVAILTIGRLESNTVRIIWQITVPLRGRATAYRTDAERIVGIAMEGEMDSEVGQLLRGLISLRKARPYRVYVTLQPFACRIKLRGGTGSELGLPVYIHPLLRGLPEPAPGDNYWSIIRILYRETSSGVKAIVQLRTIYRPPIGVELPRAMVLWSLWSQTHELDYDHLDIA